MARNELIALRTAVNESNWSKCEELIHQYLPQMELSNILRLAIKQTRNFLPKFEAYHPKINWPRKLLDMLQNEEPIDYESDPLGLYDETGVKLISPSKRIR